MAFMVSGAYHLPLAVRAQTAGSVPVNQTSTSSTTTSGSSSTASKNLDLSSTVTSVSASKTGTIMVGGQLVNGHVAGGTQMAITQGQLLTPAENAALWQSVSPTGQHLLLNSMGAAIAGNINLNSSWASNLSALVIPTGVQANAVGFNTNGSALNVGGASTISGALYALQNTAGQTAALNFANNLHIGAGGLLSGYLPTTGLFGLNTASLFGSQNMNLNVLGNLTNSGTIAVPGALNVNVGGTLSNITAGINAGVATLAAQNINILTNNIINTGLIRATDSINFGTTSSLSNLIIDNTSGTISALNAINIRDNLFTGTGIVRLVGGDWLSSSLNLNAGKGDIYADIGNVSGLVNMYGNWAHMTVASPNWNLGTVNLSVDPMLCNTGGNITINGPISTNGGDLAIVAKGNITENSSGATLIDTRGAGSGGNVWLIAGANVAWTGTDNTQTNGNLQNGNLSATVTGASGSNARIDLRLNVGGAINTSGTAGGNGGNVQMVVFTTGNKPNSINMDNTNTITTGGNGAGANGNVLIISNDNTAGNTMTIGGAINTTGGTGGGGNVQIFNSAINTSAITLTQTNSGNTITQTGGSFLPTALVAPTLPTGAPALPAGLLPTAQLKADNINVVQNITAAGNITVQTGSGQISARNIQGGGAGTNTYLVTGGNANNPAIQVSQNINNNGTSGGNVLVQVTNAAGTNHVYLNTGGTNNNGDGSAVSANGTAGNGGNIVIISGDQLQIGNPGNGSVLANAGGTGSGGSIFLVDNSSSKISTSSNSAGGQGINGILSANGAGVGGNGGNITWLNQGFANTFGGTVWANPGDISVAPGTSGSAGSITLAVSNNGQTTGTAFGPITLPNGTVNMNAAGANFSGGNLTLIGDVASAGTFNLNANGTGGAPNTISITANNAGASASGSVSGIGTISATNSGTQNGGSVSILTNATAGSPSINLSGGIDTSASGSGNGGNITIDAVNGAGTQAIAINGSLKSTSGTGIGGTISVKQTGNLSIQNGTGTGKIGGTVSGNNITLTALGAASTITANNANAVVAAGTGSLITLNAVALL